MAKKPPRYNPNKARFQPVAPPRDLADIAHEQIGFGADHHAVLDRLADAFFRLAKRMPMTVRMQQVLGGVTDKALCLLENREYVGQAQTEKPSVGAWEFHPEPKNKP